MLKYLALLEKCNNINKIVCQQQALNESPAATIIF